MNAFAVSSVMILISCAVVGIFVYIKGKHDRTAAIFCLFSLSLCFWGLGGYKIALTHSKEEAYYWWQIAFLGIISPILYTHFVITLLSLNKRKVLYAIYSIAAIFLVLDVFFKERFFGDLKFTFNQFYWVYYSNSLSTLFTYFYLIVYWVILPYSFYIILRAHNESSGTRRNQLKLFAISVIFGWTGGHLNFLPYFGIDLYPYPNFFVIIYVCIVAYLIFRHKFLDIEVIIKKTLIFAGLFAGIYSIFAFFAFLGQIFFEKFITNNRWASLIPSVLIVTLMLRPLETFLETITDKYLFQKKYSYKELLKQFTAEVLSVLELDKLIRVTEEKLSTIIKINNCRVLITESANINAEADLKLPISTDNRMLGFLLLGKKKSDEDYTQDDIDILQAVAKTLAIAVSNAKLADELSRAQAEMAEKDKMATVGTLAAGMAHEIRNPITTIRVFSEYAQDKFTDNSFLGKYRNIVVKEIDKIDHIIQTLVDFSGDAVALGEVEDVPIRVAIDELIALVGSGNDVLNRIKFVKEMPQNIDKIKVNRKEFDEILLNIVENAIHAIGGNGQIEFKAEETDDSIELEISDTGSGMSKDTIENIFNPFFTTRSKGFGLGLFVVKQLVNKNGGTISVDSVLSKGTKFTLAFRRTKA